MAWVQTSSPSFVARHEERDGEDVVAVLELLEGTRERLGEAFPSLPGRAAVVLHVSDAQLALAQPYLPLVRRLTARPGRRYLTGWLAGAEIHVLSPRSLARRASRVAGSREMVQLSPASLYAGLVVAHNNDGLPPPFGRGGFVRWLRWAWLAAGAAQYFSGQTTYARAEISRRLREGPSPAFPPSLADATLLGGSIYSLVAERTGDPSAVTLACSLPPGGARQALGRAFEGQPLSEVEDAWRSHLARMARL